MATTPRIEVVGLDPSLRNWGISKGFLEDGLLTIQSLAVISPVVSDSKQVRQNSKDLEAARQLFKSTLEATRNAQAVFVEVPVGSQSSRAMASYALCVGVLGSLRALGVPLFELSPAEVKMAAVGNKEATKKQMIDWATKTHPLAPWPYHNSRGTQVLTEGIAEHMADATAAIHAGLNSDLFQKILRLSSLQQSSVS